MADSEKGEIGFERVILFSDAIVAIAITLLALDLKLDVPANQHITFQDLLYPWKNYLAFVLSFINIAGMWRNHHYIYTYICKMDMSLLLLNIGWLFFVVTLPFCTTLVSAHFRDTPAIFLYSLNIFFLAVFQNVMWNYAYAKDAFIDKSELSEEEQKRFRFMFALDIPNGLIAIIVSFFNPTLAFILLFFKVPIFVFATFYVAAERRNGLAVRTRTGRKNRV